MNAKPTADPQPIDAAALHAETTGLLHDVGLLPLAGAGNATCRLLRDTRDYRIVLCATDSDRWLLKQDGPDAREQKMINAALAASLARARGVPTPALRCFASAISPQRRTLQVYDYIPGAVCPDDFRGLGDSERTALLAALGAGLARLHSHHAPGYGEVLHAGTFVSLKEAVGWRLDYALGMRDAFAKLDPGAISAVRARILALCDLVVADCRPVLVHGDVGPRNLILDGGQLVALIDFEHAKFHDAAYDFVKLHFLLSERAEDWRTLMSAYCAKNGTLRRFAERLSLFVGLELLSGISYWHRISDARMYDDYRKRLHAWLITSSETTSVSD